MATQLKYVYGNDPRAGENGLGAFFWANSLQKRKEALKVKRNQPVIFEAVYGCAPTLLEGIIFKEEDFAFYRPPPTLALGIRGLPQSFIDRVELIVQSWDTAFSSQSDADYSVCLTGALVACDEWHTDLHEEGEECDPHFDVYLLDEFREQLDFASLPESAKLQNARWRPNKILVEQKATGVPLISMLESSKLEIPIEGGEKATRSKKSRAIIGATAGSAQGWTRQHRVRWPQGMPWVEDHLRELKAFTGEGEEVDDRVDALTQLLNFAIEYGSQTSLLPSNIETDELLSHISPPDSGGTQQKSQQDINMIMELGETDTQITFQICKMCKNFDLKRNWCNLHEASTNALSTCEWFDISD